jgi:hypothetical protein
MRRALTPPAARHGAPDVIGDWLSLESLARVDVTSEEPAHPVEGALTSGDDRGWRASEPGPQTIRVLFDRPVHIRRVRLLFLEPEETRTQEFVLRASFDDGRPPRDLVRQQWNFAPAGSVREAEDYHVDLSGVTALELCIVPDVSSGAAHASLAQWRIA